MYQNTMYQNKGKRESRRYLKYLVLAFILFVVYYFAVKPASKGAQQPITEEDVLVATKPVADVALPWLNSLMKQDQLRCSELFSDKMAIDIYTMFLHKFAKHLGSADNLRKVFSDSEKERELIKFSLASDPDVKSVCVTDMKAATKLLPWLMGGNAHIHVLDTSNGAAHQDHLRHMKKQFPNRVTHILVNPNDVSHSLKSYDLGCSILVIDSKAPKHYALFLENLSSISAGEITVLMEEFEFQTLMTKQWDSFRRHVVAHDYFRCQFRGEQKAGIFFEKVLQEAPLPKGPAAGGL